MRPKSLLILRYYWKRTVLFKYIQTKFYWRGHDWNCLLLHIRADMTFHFSCLCLCLSFIYPLMIAYWSVNMSPQSEQEKHGNVYNKSHIIHHWIRKRCILETPQNKIHLKVRWTLPRIDYLHKHLQTDYFNIPEEKLVLYRLWHSTKHSALVSYFYRLITHLIRIQNISQYTDCPQSLKLHVCQTRTWIICWVVLYRMEKKDTRTKGAYNKCGIIQHLVFASISPFASDIRHAFNLLPVIIYSTE